MSEYLQHVTLNTGHVRRSPRSEADAGVVEALKFPLRHAIRTGGVVEALETGWFFAASETPGELAVRLWADKRPEIGETAALLFHVDAAGDVPELRVSLSASAVLTLDPERFREAVDLERCLAWTWLDGL